MTRRVGDPDLEAILRSYEEVRLRVANAVETEPPDAVGHIPMAVLEGFADGVVTIEELRPFEAHLSGCDRCRRNVAEFESRLRMRAGPQVVTESHAFAPVGSQSAPSARTLTLRSVVRAASGFVPGLGVRSRGIRAAGALVLVLAVVALGLGGWFLRTGRKAFYAASPSTRSVIWVPRISEYTLQSGDDLPSVVERNYTKVFLSSDEGELSSISERIGGRPSSTAFVALTGTISPDERARIIAAIVTRNPALRDITNPPPGIRVLLPVLAGRVLYAR
jgi:putative zinc finger protein